MKLNETQIATLKRRLKDVAIVGGTARVAELAKVSLKTLYFTRSGKNVQEFTVQSIYAGLLMAEDEAKKARGIGESMFVNDDPAVLADKSLNRPKPKAEGSLTFIVPKLLVTSRTKYEDADNLSVEIDTADVIEKLHDENFTVIVGGDDEDVVEYLRSEGYAVSDPYSGNENVAVNFNPGSLVDQEVAEVLEELNTKYGFKLAEALRKLL